VCIALGGTEEYMASQMLKAGPPMRRAPILPPAAATAAKQPFSEETAELTDAAADAGSLAAKGGKPAEVNVTTREKKKQTVEALEVPALRAALVHKARRSSPGTASPGVLGAGKSPVTCPSTSCLHRASDVRGGT